jgi:hypothetical protein
MDSLYLLIPATLLFAASFFSLFHTKEFLAFMLESKGEYLEQQGYSNKEIEKWIDDRKTKEWLWFYKGVGIFGLFIALVVIILTLSNFINR